MKRLASVAILFGALLISPISPGMVSDSFDDNGVLPEVFMVDKLILYYKKVPIEFFKFMAHPDRFSFDDHPETQTILSDIVFAARDIVALDPSQLSILDMDDLGGFTIYLGAHYPEDALWLLSHKLEKQNPDVIQASPVTPYLPFFNAPDDPLFSDQWNLNDPVSGINIQAAWDLLSNPDKVVKPLSDIPIAVIDTGLLPHRDMDDHLSLGQDFISNATQANDGDGPDGNATDTAYAIPAHFCGPDFPRHDTVSSWHGTHVCGLISALIGNHEGIAGIHPHPRIIPARLLGRCGISNRQDIKRTIEWAIGLGLTASGEANAYPAKILNLSWGREQRNTQHDYYLQGLMTA